MDFKKQDKDTSKYYTRSRYANSDGWYCERLMTKDFVQFLSDHGALSFTQDRYSGYDYKQVMLRYNYVHKYYQVIVRQDLAKELASVLDRLSMRWNNENYAVSGGCIVEKPWVQIEIPVQ